MDGINTAVVPLMCTYSGKRFNPIEPNVDDISIVDIAHSLSNVCRYGGQCKEFYCPTPDQRILTADLKWVPAGDLLVGDELIAFDEFPFEIGSAGVKRRRFRYSKVKTATNVKRKIYLIEMADGATVVASAEHPWLVATQQSRNQVWSSTQKLVEDLNCGRKRYMHKFISPWEGPKTWQEGWLAGIMDGEGHISFDGLPQEIVKIYPLGEQWVSGLETTSKTYICEGFGAHNSVAQHSVICSWEASYPNKKWALLHDASEAYIGDIIAPLKVTPQYESYRAIEENLMMAVCERFNLPIEQPEEVHEIDLLVRHTEMRDFGSIPEEFWEHEEKLDYTIIPLAPKDSKILFLKTFANLFGYDDEAWRYFE